MDKETLTSSSRWEGAVSAKVEDVNADQIWPFIKDFFGIHKYIPDLQVSYGVEGINGEVGSIRYCEAVVSPPSAGDGNVKPVVHWAKEKVSAIDPDQRSLTYEIIDNNIGLRSHVATLKAVNDDDDQSPGCFIEFSLSFDASEGVRFEDYVKKYQIWVEKCSRNMKNSLVK